MRFSENLEAQSLKAPNPLLYEGGTPNLEPNEYVAAAIQETNSILCSTCSYLYVPILCCVQQQNFIYHHELVF